METGLGELVQLIVRPLTEKSAAVPLGPAQLLLFTGVRYERGEANEPDKPSASSGSKRRRG
jgi:hypothetical protein